MSDKVDDTNAELPEKPGLDAAVANGRVLLRRTIKIMPLLWLGAVFWALSSIFLFTHSGESLAPSELPLWGTALFPYSFFSEFTGGAWFAFGSAALAFPLAKAHLVEDSRSESEASEVSRQGIGKQVIFGLGVAIYFHAGTAVGFALLMVPGMVFAFLFLPLFYLAMITQCASRGWQVLLIPPRQALRHWKLNSLVAIGILGTCYGLPMVTALLIGLCAPGGNLSAVEWDGMLTAIIAAGVVAVLVVQYVLFVLGVGAALAMEEYERLS